MAKKAVDVVLLPDEEMTRAAIQANTILVEKFGEKIVLNKENCLPHISLAMGCIDESEVGDIGKVLEDVAGRTSVKLLSISELEISTTSSGEKVSAFSIEKTNELQLLHEEVMETAGEYFRYDVSSEMLYGSEKIAESTLHWIRNYRDKSGFENFWPHITIGYGVLDNFKFSRTFTAERLALCHLGNHCTCRVILTSVEIQ